MFLSAQIEVQSEDVERCRSKVDTRYVHDASPDKAKRIAIIRVSHRAYAQSLLRILHLTFSWPPDSLFQAIVRRDTCHALTIWPFKYTRALAMEE